MEKYKNEHDFQNIARKYLTSKGYLSFRVNVGTVKMADGRIFKTGLPPGFSDLVVLKNGKTWFVELKTGNNKPTQKQINFLAQMGKNGFGGGVAWTLRDIDIILDHYPE